MPNFEQPLAPPPEPEKGPPLFSESKEQQAQGAVTRLGNGLRRWKDVYIASIVVGQIASSAIDLVKVAYEEDQERAREAAKLKKEHEPGLEVDIRFDELRALDPEASPERIRFILDTLPEGFVEGEVIRIGFEDEVLPAREDYHLHAGAETAATAGGGTSAERTVITFWRGAKDNRSDWIWGDAMIHEIGHANDWETDLQLDDAEKAELKKRVIERVQAPDRFKSSYVEGISNPDKTAELESKAKEYWAEIVAAYLNGKLDPFGPDGELVAEYIAKNDPDFDRTAALEARKQIIGEMSIEENVADYGYGSLPTEERDAVEARVVSRIMLEVDPPDPTLQRQGRKELAVLMARHGATEEGQRFMITLARYEELRQAVYESRLEIDDDEGQQKVLMGLADAYQEMERAAEAYPGADLARKEFEETLDGYGIWAGGEKKPMVLERGELAEISPSQDRFWIPYNLSWRGSQEDDTLDEYLERKVFTMPE
jgi:hypothetical protein